MLLKRSLMLLVITLVGLGFSYAQEVPTDASTQQKPLTDEEQKAQVLEQKALEQEKLEQEKLEKEAQKKAEQAKLKEVASKAKPPKEVFKPTEEISEDSPVPFPVDI